MIVAVGLGLGFSPQVKALVALVRLGLRLAPKLPGIVTALRVAANGLETAAKVVGSAEQGAEGALRVSGAALKQAANAVGTVSVPKLNIDPNTKGFYDALKNGLDEMHIPILFTPPDQVIGTLNELKVLKVVNLDKQDNPFSHVVTDLSLAGKTVENAAEPLRSDLTEAAKGLRDIADVLAGL